jgi:hypothetical protein
MIQHAEKTKRIRFRRIDLETIKDALEHHIEFLHEELVRHEDDKTRFEQPDEWLQKRERLNLKLTNAKVIRNKIMNNLKGARGRTPESVEDLLQVSTEDEVGEYMRFVEAVPFVNFDNVGKAMTDLFNAVQRGVVNSYNDPDEGGLVKVRKLDVLRFSAYLESNK